MKVERTCARCKKKYIDDVESVFITCPKCRVPVGRDGGGCHFWKNAARDPRLYGHGYDERALQP